MSNRNLKSYVKVALRTPAQKKKAWLKACSRSRRKHFKCMALLQTINPSFSYGDALPVSVDELRKLMKKAKFQSNLYARHGYTVKL